MSPDDCPALMKFQLEKNQERRREEWNWWFIRNKLLRGQHLHFHSSWIKITFLICFTSKFASSQGTFSIRNDLTLIFWQDFPVRFFLLGTALTQGSKRWRIGDLSGCWKGWNCCSIAANSLGHGTSRASSKVLPGQGYEKLGAPGAACSAWCKTFPRSSVERHFKARPVSLAKREPRSNGWWKTSVPITPQAAEIGTAAVFLGIFMGT